MLKEHDTLLRQLLIVVDLAIVLTAFFIAHYLRQQLAFLYDSSVIKVIYPVETYLSILPVLLIIWGGALQITGVYQPFRGKNITHMLLDIFKAVIIATLFFGSFAYILKIQFVSRLLIFLISILTWLLLSMERIFIIYSLYYARKHGYNTRYMLIVGTGKRAQGFIQLISDHPEWGFRIAGLIDDEEALKGQEIRGYKVLGLIHEIPAILNQMIIDEIVFIVPRAWLGRIENAINYCEQVGKRVSVAMDLFTTKFAKAKQTDLHDFPLLMFQSTSDKLWQLLLKRLLDITVSLATLVLLFPLMTVIVLMIKISSGGPILFKQVRCSLNGRLFTMYKFRTMIVNAEEKLEALRKHNEMSGPVFKMHNDPRIVGFGKWLRRFSLDELPQLINILRGDMSIVGPRPPIPAEVKKYEPWQRRRLSMRPGLTCLWQIEGRNKIVKFDEWMRLDLEYIDHWSLWLDLKICLRTIPVVLFGIGAK